MIKTSDKNSLLLSFSDGVGRELAEDILRSHNLRLFNFSGSIIKRGTTEVPSGELNKWIDLLSQESAICRVAAT